jgi:drug/metabolite transporter (DMT)-like permease
MHDTPAVSPATGSTGAVASAATAAPTVRIAPWLLVALLAHTGWGVYPVFARYLQTESQIPSMVLLATSTAPLALAFFTYGVPRFGRTILHSRPLWLFAGVVVLRSLTNVLAARYTQAIYVQLMTLMTPFLVALLSLVVLREQLPRGTLTAMALSFVGSLLMLSSNLAEGGLHFALQRTDLLGIGLALTSAVFLSLYMIVVRRTMATAVSALGVLLFQSAVVFSVSLTLSLLLGEEWGRWRGLQASDWAVFGVFALLILTGANALQIVALRKLGAPVVSSLMGWRLVSTLVVGILLLGEGLHGWVQGLGMVIVLATVTWFVRKEAHKRP